MNSPSEIGAPLPSLIPNNNDHFGMIILFSLFIHVSHDACNQTHSKGMLHPSSLDAKV
jgi:hypothetical protein